MFHNTGTGATGGGEFTDGDEALGVPRSVLGADWLNMMQREGLSLLTEGGITPNAGAFNQWTLAIAAMIAAAPGSFKTGMAIFTISTAADPGWILADDGTIGDAASGATTRANADTSALFAKLWDLAAGDAPIYDSTGGASVRGASSAADFAANKRISVLKTLGRALGVAGAGSGLTARAVGHAVGEETHLLTGQESGIQNHNHQLGGRDSTADNSGTNPGDEFIQPYGYSGSGAGPAVDSSYAGNTNAVSAHNNMQPTTFMNLMIKL